MINPMDCGAIGDGSVCDAAAVLACIATGHDVYLPGGHVFDMGGEIIRPTSGQRVFGSGELLFSSYPSCFCPVGAYDAPRFFDIEDVEDVEIDGIRINYTGATTVDAAGKPINVVFGMTTENATGTVINNVKFRGGVTPIYVHKGSVDTRISNCSMKASGLFGIATGGDRYGNTDGIIYNTMIENNFIRGFLSEGIDINWDTQFCTIRGNHIFGNGLDGEEQIDVGGGGVNGCRDIIIDGNVIDANGVGKWGILVKMNPTKVTKKVVITNNIVRNMRLDATDGAGINLENTYDAIVRGNHVYNAYRGIKLRLNTNNCDIVGNKVSNCTEAGIWTGATSNRHKIVMNTMDGCGQGIGFSAGGDRYIVNMNDGGGSGYSGASTLTNSIVAGNF